MAVGKEADVADAMEAVRHGMLQKAADEFVSGECHDLGLSVVSIVLPGETDLAVFKSDQPAVGDGDTVGITAEITEDLFGSREWGFAKDHPVDLGQRVDVGGEAGGVARAASAPEKRSSPSAKAARSICRSRSRKQRESTLMGRKKPGGQAIQRV